MILSTIKPIHTTVSSEFFGTSMMTSLGYIQFTGSVASHPNMVKNGVWPVLLCTVVFSTKQAAFTSDKHLRILWIHLVLSTKNGSFSLFLTGSPDQWRLSPLRSPLYSAHEVPSKIWCFFIWLNRYHNFLLVFWSCLKLIKQRKFSETCLTYFLLFYVQTLSFYDRSGMFLSILFLECIYALYGLVGYVCLL